MIAYQAEQAELADMLDEEGGAYEALTGPFDPLTSSVSKGPRTIRKRNPEDGAGVHPSDVRLIVAFIESVGHHGMQQNQA